MANYSLNRTNRVHCSILDENCLANTYTVKFDNGVVRNVPKSKVTNLDRIDEGVLNRLKKVGSKLLDNIVKAGRYLYCAVGNVVSNTLFNVMFKAETRDGIGFYPSDTFVKVCDEAGVEPTITEEDDLDEEESAILREFEKVCKKDTFQLMENEISNLISLIDLGKQITHESRIDQIIKIVEDDYPNKNVLFFTEYKKTQSLLMSELMKKWGLDCVTFINGDEALQDVIMPDGSKKDFSIKRTDAAEKFNESHVRFLISTEAAGEGIDLQKNCHVLIHADIPWNPMRLHQRVGRINRYGQKQDVDVITLRNPDTVESQIWTKLELKIMNITKAFSAGMSDPDDMMMLVLGMQKNKFYDDLYSEGFSAARKGNVSSWFDSREKTFGGEQAISLISNMVGNAAKFNLEGLPDVPKCDLKDLKNFFKRAISLQGKRLTINEDKYSFITPMEWFNEYGIKPRYDNLIFRRKPKEGESAKDICGVGHIAFDKCLDFADTLPSSACCIKGNVSYFIYKALNQKNYSGDRINKDLIFLAFDSANNTVSEMKLDDGLKIINTVDKNEAENFVTEVPDSVRNFAEERLKTFNYDLPLLELVYALSGEK